jgi:dipeptidyl aminopeptidase/acylaminoacyl peptidase
MFVPSPRRRCVASVSALVAACLLLGQPGSTEAFTPANPAAQPTTAEVPLRAFLDFEVPEDHWRVALSPDGEQAAYFTRVAGATELWRWSRTADEHSRWLASGVVPGDLVEFLWLPDSERLLLRARETTVTMTQVRTREGMVDRPVRNVADRLFLLSGEDDPREVTPDGSTRARLLAVDADLPDTVLLGVEGIVPGLFDVAHLDARTGEVTVIFQPPVGVTRYLTGPDLQVLAMERMAKRNYFNERALLPNADLLPDAQLPLVRWVDADVIRCGALWMSPDLKTFVSKDSRGRDETVVLRTDVERGFSEVLSQRAGVDCRSALIDEETGQVLAVSYERGTVEWDLLDDSLRADFDLLESTLVHGFDISERVAGGDVWLVRAPDQYGLVDYWRYERQGRTLTRICSDRETLRDWDLGRMETLSYTAEDGTTLHGYLTLPPEMASSADLDDSAMVLLPYITLWERAHFRYDSFAQWLANRGYAVFTPVARGAPGFGKRFERLGYADFDGPLLSDHLDCARWLAESGYTSPGRLAVVGHSIAGSLATLALGRGEGLFAAGVNYLGMLDFIRMLEVLPEQNPMAEYYKERIGDPVMEKSKLAQVSPVASLVTADRPFFFVWRGGDAGIRQEDLLALGEFGTYRDLPTIALEIGTLRDGSLSPEVRGKADRLLASFLAFVLGGRAEPIWESDYTEDVRLHLDSGYLLWEEPIDAAGETPAEDNPELPIDLPDSPG